MKSNFIKYDGSQESIDLIKQVVDRANKKYNGIHKYEMGIGIPTNGCQDHIWISSTNLEDEEDGELCQTSVGAAIGYYVFFDIPENVPSYSSDFPSFSACVEGYYLEYKEKMEL